MKSIKIILVLALFVLKTFTLFAQVQTGVYKTNTGNVDYHHFIRDGGGSAVYINQASIGAFPILRLSSGIANANQFVKFTVENNGSVGIGTIDPQEKLDVEGVILSKTFKSKSTNTEFHHFTRNQTGSAVYINQMTVSKDAPILRLSSGTYEPNQNVKFTVENNGAVGIGTISTGTDMLAVNGSIRTKEIKVEISGWSDFVFEDNYQLRSLLDVESFIEKNRHLPDIPSEKEVKEKGVNLGDMDAKLLQKIEELTLYVIQLSKENNEFRERLKKLEADN